VQTTKRFTGLETAAPDYETLVQQAINKVKGFLQLYAHNTKLGNASSKTVERCSLLQRTPAPQRIEKQMYYQTEKISNFKSLSTSTLKAGTLKAKTHTSSSLPHGSPAILRGRLHNISFIVSFRHDETLFVVRRLLVSSIFRSYLSTCK